MITARIGGVSGIQIGVIRQNGSLPISFSKSINLKAGSELALPFYVFQSVLKGPCEAQFKRSPTTPFIISNQSPLTVVPALL